ncbi:DUF547 domain-containing protein [Idiomarina aminovorans]|uniref:DUF547 domain-containing protein n=1 Tax=Idiomarina aminovorans TaxID=2914829 RepID=UPI002002B043|nr:DUF547 domain-containing protein [Idiomarina sp. ATCH4]MCK7458013.1 DUF547 domain-containing protein [Idiomarina sp. ATCH4]
MTRLILVIWGLCFQMAAFAQSFDHSHEAFSDVLEKHVVVYDDNLKSAVDYKQLAQNRQRLDSYLTSLSQVQKNEYQNWTQSQQLAFLINAYNGFTLQLIIDNIAKFESGNAESIRDLGGFFTSPWEQDFFNLLGQKRTLDWVEHEKIRVDFDEPRIHAALVCAAVSCPKLRAEAFTGDQLESQLESQMFAFLSDRDKNGIDEKGLYLSKIFDWYRDDFGNIRDYMRQYAGALTNKAEHKQRLNSETPIRYTDYNWQLNDVQNR